MSESPARRDTPGSQGVSPSGRERPFDTTYRSILQVVEEARYRLPEHLWDHATGGAGSEATVRRNTETLDAVRFRPRVLRDVARRTTGTTVLGMDLAAPLALAPVGPVELYDADGALAAARAAANFGTFSMVAMTSSPALEVVAEDSDADLVFQLYLRGDHDWIDALVARIEAGGYRAICLTVDAPAYGRRERDLRHGFVHSDHQRQPNLGERAERLGRGEEFGFQMSATWDDVSWLRERTSLPLVVKGIMTGEDARRASDLGVDAVYVSNHGGRLLDHQLGTIEVLREVVEAADPATEILIDGGFLHGEDVAKALCLGADAVLLGRLQLYGLAAGGSAGLTQVLHLLTDEMLIVMALLGVADVAALYPELVVAAR